MKVNKKVCNECPFSNKSLKGWLGPHKINDILDSVQFESAFSCHMERTDEITHNDILSGNINVCRGFMLSAKKSCKLFGQNHTPDSQGLKKLQKEMTIDNKELTDILSKWEFKTHHEL